MWIGALRRGQGKGKQHDSKRDTLVSWKHWLTSELTAASPYPPPSTLERGGCILPTCKRRQGTTRAHVPPRRGRAGSGAGEGSGYPASPLGPVLAGQETGVLLFYKEPPAGCRRHRGRCHSETGACETSCVAGMLIRLFIVLLRPVPQSPPVSLCLKGEGGSGEVTSWEALGRSCFRLLFFFPQPGPCSCRIMSCRQLPWSVSSSWVPLGSAQQLWQGAHAQVPPVGCRAPAPGPHHTLCCCRWAKFPPGERDFPHSGRLLLPRQLPSLSWHLPAEAKVHVS